VRPAHTTGQSRSGRAEATSSRSTQRRLRERDGIRRRLRFRSGSLNESSLRFISAKRNRPSVFSSFGEEPTIRRRRRLGPAALRASALTENSPVALARNGPARDRRSADRAMRKPGVGPSVARGAEDLIGRGGWQRSPPRAWVAPRSGREFLAQSGETQAVTSRELMTATSGAHLANKSR
jgi:hypothetical protein